MTTAPCPHCGRPDAPVDDQSSRRPYLDRHRRLDWDRVTSRSNEICAAERTPVGEPCCRVPSPNCRLTTPTQETP